MSAAIPTREPDHVRQGDTVTWLKELGDWPPADGWTLKYAFAKSDARILITATDNGDGRHLIDEAATSTADWAIGHYEGHAVVENAGGERYTVWRGRLEVRPGLHLASAADGYDARDHARKMLDALEAASESRATSTQLSYSIGNRSLSLMGPTEILHWIGEYRRRVARLDAELRRDQGRSPRTSMKIRFREPS